MKKACNDMIVKSWMIHQSLGGNVVKFLNSLDVENNEETVVLALRPLLDDPMVIQKIVYICLTPKDYFFYSSL